MFFHCRESQTGFWYDFTPELSITPKMRFWHLLARSTRGQATIPQSCLSPGGLLPTCATVRIHRTIGTFLGGHFRVALRARAQGRVLISTQAVFNAANLAQRAQQLSQGSTREMANTLHGSQPRHRIYKGPQKAKTHDRRTHRRARQREPPLPMTRPPPQSTVEPKLKRKLTS